MPQTSSKEVLSLRTVRLASTSGHVVIVTAGIPKRIPRALFEEAARKGCVDYNPQMIEAFKRALERAEEPGSSKQEIDVSGLVREAVTQVMLAAADAPQLVTSAGVPRVPAVRAAFEELCTKAGIDPVVKITQEVVASVYGEITASQSDSDDEVTEEPRYPRAVTGDLEGEEVGGVDDDLLERVTSIEE